jgi:hypothetical protein
MSTPQAATATATPTASMLSLSYNSPLPVPQNYSAICNPTSQAMSILQVQNLSTSFTLAFYVNAGSYTYQGSIPANVTTPWAIPQNFAGSMLTVTNLSSESATAQVTLKST